MKNKTVFAALSLMAAACPCAASVILSDNLAAPTEYSQSPQGVTQSDWFAARFATDASGYTLESVVLRLELTSTTGTALAAIYSDAAAAPGSLVGALVSPVSYPVGGHLDSEFAGAGIALAADTTYWVVLQAIDGTFDWAWTDDNSGSGVGFEHVWSSSDDSGTSWLTFMDSPQIMQVNAVSVPAPAVLWLIGIGLVGIGAARGRSSAV